MDSQVGKWIPNRNATEFCPQLMWRRGSLWPQHFGLHGPQQRHRDGGRGDSPGWKASSADYLVGSSDVPVSKTILRYSATFSATFSEARSYLIWGHDWWRSGTLSEIFSCALRAGVQISNTPTPEIDVCASDCAQKSWNQLFQAISWQILQGW